MTLELHGAGLASSLALVGLMGFRHGFDADHIAVVDGMTRARQLHRSYWTSRLVGLQFALGHSATILVAAMLLFGQRWALPAWLDGLGTAVSIGFLLFIAASNLGHALTPAGDGARPLGPVSAALFKATGHHLHPALVGMAFAFSLDAMGQAAFFAASSGPGSAPAAAYGGLGAVALLAGTFGLGMTLADAANGLLLSWFAQRSDGLARQASRFSSAFIAGIALLTVAAAVLRESQAGFARVWEQAGVWVGVGLVVFTAIVYSLRLALQRAQAARAAAAGAA
jgi:high-affinity nickel-transport protein